MNFKKLILACLLAAFVFVGLSFKANEASAMSRCSIWQNGVCTQYRPDYPTGGGDCGVWGTPLSPAPGEVFIYSQPNRGGFCVRLPARMGLWNLDTNNGWYGPYYVKDIWVGSAMNAGQVCYQEWGRVCVDLWAGYDYSYTAPTYQYAWSPGWQSISVWNW